MTSDEQPEADAIEQQQLVDEKEDDELVPIPPEIPVEADPADAAEQWQVVDLGDDDDYYVE